MIVFSWDRDIFFGNPEDDEPEDRPEMDGEYLYDGEEDDDYDYVPDEDEEGYEWDYEPYDPIEPPDYSHYMY